MSWLNDAATRVCRGTSVLINKKARGIGAWLREGEGASDALVRWGALAFVGFVAWRLFTSTPRVLWFAVPAFVVAAYRLGDLGEKPAAKPTAAPAKAPAIDRDELLLAVLRAIGARRGIHVAELYPALRKLPALTDADDAALRARLTTAGVTVVRAMRAENAEGEVVEGRSGVRREDVAQALSAPPPAAPLESGGEPGEAGQGPSLRKVSGSGESDGEQSPPDSPPAGEGAEQLPRTREAAGRRFTFTDDPDNPHRTNVEVTKTGRRSA